MTTDSVSRTQNRRTIAAAREPEPETRRARGHDPHVLKDPFGALNVLKGSFRTSTPLPPSRTGVSS